MALVLELAVTVAQFILGFYAFWLVWRALLPILPGPADPAQRLAPFARYFTDPLLRPLAAIRFATPLASLVLLIVIAALEVGLGRLVRAL